MGSYPYDYKDGRNNGWLSENLENLSIICVSAVLLQSMFVRTAVASELISSSGGAINSTIPDGGTDPTNGNGSWKAIAVLAAVDSISCAKATKCGQAAKDYIISKTKEEPKLIPAIVCTAAAVWCARGVADRVIRQRL